MLVGGAAAEFIDQQDAIASSLPLGVGLLIALTMIVLWMMTGSIVLPVKAIVMNALTVGSALGILTLGFQDGRFESLLGYTANGGVEPTDFLVAAALIFALSTDYGVFLLGRIKEARDGGISDREAVAVDVERTEPSPPPPRSCSRSRSARSSPPRSRSSSRSASPPPQAS
jgi:uncharacterized membrane protein YdfJ with MMPL/SSD domain